MGGSDDRVYLEKVFILGERLFVGEEGGGVRKSVGTFAWIAWIAVASGKEEYILGNI